MKIVPPVYFSCIGSFPEVCDRRPGTDDTNRSVNICEPGRRCPFLIPPSFTFLFLLLQYLLTDDVLFLSRIRHILIFAKELTWF